MYYTDLPTKKRPRSVISITKPGCRRFVKKEQLAKNKKSSKNTVKVEVTERLSLNAPPWIGRVKRDDNLVEDFPIVEMKLCSRRRTIKKTELDIEDKLPGKEKLDVGMSLKHCLTSPAVAVRNKADNSRVPQPTAMKTIRMQLQVSTPGDSFAYASALPNNSHLTTTKINFL